MRAAFTWTGMSALSRAAWSVFGVDVVLGAVLIAAALTDTGDAAGRGLAEVYAVGCAMMLVAFGAILSLVTFLQSRIGFWLAIAIMAAPPILYVVGVAARLSG